MTKADRKFFYDLAEFLEGHQLQKAADEVRERLAKIAKRDEETN